MSRHGPLLALTLGSPSEPVRAVCYDREHGQVGNDSGYLVVFADAPAPGVVDESAEGWLCFGCLIDDHPGVGRALDLAREVGEVWQVAGDWVALDDVDDDEIAAACREVDA